MENSIIRAKYIKKKGIELSLSEHTNDVLKTFGLLQDKLKEDSKNLIPLIKLGIFLHDLGKCHPYFQLHTIKNGVYKPFDLSSNIYHSLFSVLWINQNKLIEEIKKHFENDTDAKDYFLILLSAVAYHHWKSPVENQISSSTEFERFLRKTQENGYLKNLENNLMFEIKKFDENYDSLIEFNEVMLDGLSRGVSFSEYVIPPYQLYWLPKRKIFNLDDTKSKNWILISGFLMRSDHFASFCEDNGQDVINAEIKSINEDEIKENIIKEIQLKTKVSTNKIWQLNEIKELKDKNVILVAPTGYGKTEFAFLWAGDRKFFYTLPLRSAVNQIYERAKNIFENTNEEKVGLLHSDADIYLLDDKEESDSIKAWEQTKQLSYPAIISTGDQFFPSALRPPGFEKIFATFSYSKLIIDEVQAYDPRAAAIVVKFMQDVIRMGGKFLLMTATLPSFIEKALERLSIVNKKDYDKKDIYKDRKKELSAFKKHKIKLQLIKNGEKDKKPVFEFGEEIDEIIRQAQNGKRILVILNTVKQAQNVYSKIIEKQKDNVWLLHARYSFNDRRKIELAFCGSEYEVSTNKTEFDLFGSKIDLTFKKGEVQFPLSPNNFVTLKYEIKEGEKNKLKIVGLFQNPKPIDEKEGKILIATQVVEASLDIDADILFTEIAPMDSLVQRMGRVLRRIQLNFDGNIINKGNNNQIVNDQSLARNEEGHVIIWAFQNGLESGNGRVYERELIGITLYLLNQEEDIETWVSDWYSKKDWADKENLIMKIKFQNSSYSLSEYEKYEMVNKLYDNLKEGEYLNKFYQTLQILELGYVSDRKEEAQKMFRDIATISVIPIMFRDNLKSDIKNFFKVNIGKENLYTLFKKNILSKYVVNVYPKKKIEFFLANNKISDWINLEQFPDDEQRKKAARWMESIYFVNYGYDHKIGAIPNKDNTEQEDFVDNIL